MMNMDKGEDHMRPYQIMCALLDATGYVSVTFLMDQLGVSKRTVQNEIAYLRKSGKSHGFILHNIYAKGYFLEIADQTAVENFTKGLNSNEAVVDEEHLVIDMIGELLLAPGAFLSAQSVADTLQVSKSLIFSKIQTVADYLNAYHLTLERKSHYGIRIRGNQAAIRQLMLALYMRSDNHFKAEADKRLGDFSKYQRLVEVTIQKYNLRVGYYEFQMLMTWLKVMVISEQLGPHQTLSQGVPMTTAFDDVFQAVLEDFALAPDIQAQVEFQQLVQKLVQPSSKPDIKVDRQSLEETLKTYFRQVDAEHQMDFSQDQDFLKQLTTHLMFLFDRLNQNISYKNPMLLELCIRYPMIFDIVLKFSSFLETQYHEIISLDELGFITVHFLNHVENERNKRLNRYDRVAVVCTTGGGVSNLIRTQILGLFPTSTVQTFSFWETADLKAFDPNLIFTVVPLDITVNVPTLYIKELLTRRDLANIKQILCLDDTPGAEAVTQAVTKDYVDLLHHDLFLVTQAVDYHAVIKTMAQQQIDNGYATDGFIEQVMQREDYMSTIFNNGLAMPHPIEMNAPKSGIGVAVITNDFQEAGRPVKIVFMVNLRKSDLDLYQNISSGLFQLMQSPEKIAQISRHQVFQEVCDVLRSFPTSD
jgi:lichenan operon transcriptional antiterminator